MLKTRKSKNFVSESKILVTNFYVLSLYNSVLKLGNKTNIRTSTFM